ncbi:MAG TPA: heparinase II/III family protein [Verrucomicrobiae bacterium]|nr:heparinase II/III family protein [Verrucomicrobiae bacterium]
MNRRAFVRTGAGAAAMLFVPSSWSAEARLFRLATAAPQQAVPSLSVPEATQILSTLKAVHPRLLISKESVEHLKIQIASDPLLRQWHKTLIKKAQDILLEEPSRYEIPDGLRLLDTSRRVVSRVYTLALAYRLDGDRRYAERAWRELAAAAAFKDWNPRHFLDTAEMTHAFAIGYDWLYDVWTPEQRETICQSIVEKGFQPALKVYRANNWWASARHNWNQVCNGGIGMGALAVGDVEPQVAGEVLHFSLKSLPLAMSEFAPDGAWKEGPGYWNYATSYNVVFLAGLQTALGTDFGLSKLPGFSDTGLFPLYLTGPLRRTFNYADGGDGAIRAPQMFWLARQFNRPVYADYERQLAAPAPLDLVWFYSPGDAQAPGLPLDKYFRNAKVVTLRSDWHDWKAWFVGFKGGDNKANHSHLDLGTFVFDALGARWAVDLGADNYNLPGYFDFAKRRWTYYRLRAEGHNTLVINPGAGPDQVLAASSPIERFDPRPDRPFAIADLSRAYQGAARKVRRGISLERGNTLLIQDEIQADKPAEVWWFMHTPANVEIEKDGRRAILRQKGEELEAGLLSPANATFEVMDAAPLPESPHPVKQAKNNVRKLAIHLTGVTESRLAVRLAASSQNARSNSNAPLVPLSEW